MKRIILIFTICAIMLISLCSCSLFVTNKLEETETETQKLPSENVADKENETAVDELGDKQTAGETTLESESETESETVHNIIVGDTPEDEDENNTPVSPETGDDDWELEGVPIG